MPTTTNFGWTTPADTDLVKDGALAIRTLGNGVDTSLVDLKGGATGDSLVKASATDLDYNWTRLADQVLANPVINGGMDIWQRNTSIAGATNATTFTADRWNAFRASSATGSTFSRQNTSDTTNLPNIQYCVRVARDSGNTSTAAIILDSSIESVNSRPFAGKTVTLSFYARKGANYSNASDGLGVALVTGTGTDQNELSGFTGSNSVVNQTATLTTTWQRFAYSATVGSTATQLAVKFTFTPVGTAGAADYFEVTGVQIDVGTFTAANAPTFRRSGGTIQGELGACQRYYLQNDTGVNDFANGAATSTTIGRFIIPFPTQMRTNPTGLITQNLTISRLSTGVTYTGGTFAIAYSTKQNLEISYTHGSAIFAAGDTLIIYGNNANSYYGWSAEL